MMFNLCMVGFVIGAWVGPILTIDDFGFSIGATLAAVYSMFIKRLYE